MPNAVPTIRARRGAASAGPNERERHTRDKRDKQGRVGRGSHGSPARREEEGARGCGRGQPQPGARDGTREEHGGREEQQPAAAPRQARGQAQEPHEEEELQQHKHEEEERGEEEEDESVSKTRGNLGPTVRTGICALECDTANQLGISARGLQDSQSGRRASIKRLLKEASTRQSRLRHAPTPGRGCQRGARRA